MRMSAMPGVLLAAAIAAGCSEAPTTYELPVASESLASRGHSLANYGTHATGDEHVPVARDTRAQGQLKLQLSKDGRALDYKLVASNIENVFMAHLHMAPAGSNGGVVVWLYPSPDVRSPRPTPGRHDGVLAEGTIRAEHLTGGLSGLPLSSLIDAIEAGDIYVNVHTNDFVGPVNTGPGDFPAGELRGQVE